MRAGSCAKEDEPDQHVNEEAEGEALAALLFLFPTLAHTYLETPADQYHTWAHSPGVNLLRTNAPVLGVAAAVITILLSAFAFATLIAFSVESRKRSTLD